MSILQESKVKENETESRRLLMVVWWGAGSWRSRKRAGGRANEERGVNEERRKRERVAGLNGERRIGRQR